MAETPPIMIDVQNISKIYGKKTVVDNVSFKVSKGSICGFLGPNGSGKTKCRNACPRPGPRGI